MVGTLELPDVEPVLFDDGQVVAGVHHCARRIGQALDSAEGVVNVV